MALHSRSSSHGPGDDGTAKIDKLDFDRHRKPPPPNDGSDSSGPGGLLRDDESLLSNILDGVIERDRRKLRRNIIKYASFVCAIFCCLCAGSITTFSLYAPLFLSRLRYTQFQVNAVSITSELFQYLPVVFGGYVSDRYSARVVSLAAGVFFGAGYLLAAVTYKQGPRQQGGWSPGVMMVAFIGVGLGTCTLVIGALSTQAKNFAKSKHRGLALSLPIAAYGLSGLWISQVGSRLFISPGRTGRAGDMDVYRYFIFLSGLLFAVGLTGAVALRVIDEEELIDEAVEDLERSGYLEENSLLQRSVNHERTSSYGTLPRPQSSHSSVHSRGLDDGLRKTLVLDTETRRFLMDPAMWILAAGVFFVTGTGETFINNLGTIISTLYPARNSTIPPSNSAATNVSTVAISSTIARLLTGSLSDLFAPMASHESNPRSFAVSRLAFLLASGIFSALSQALLASTLVQHHPALFLVVSAITGLAYGTAFSIVPIIISVVWGAQNFGTNYGIILLVPAGGAAVYSAVYSAVYQRGVAPGAGENLCYGYTCYGASFLAMLISSLVAVGLWVYAWRGWRQKGVVV
ncbi:putative monocarboxylate transporter mch1 [Pseudocyphellaria aurata]|nr:putative monocarboxylate transporter mch1 [Pseudocyphellaria aurata]